MNNPEFYIDHEVRLRLVEKTSKEIIQLLRWILGGVVVAVIIPVLLHYFGAA